MSGEILKLWLKRAHGQPMELVAEAELVADHGIRGNVNQGGRRQVTVIDLDGWRAAENELGSTVDPSARRANVLVRGIDLRESEGKILRLGETVIRLAGRTRPCEQMDAAHQGLRAALGPDWRSGAYGEIVEGGTIRVGDRAELTP